MYGSIISHILGDGSIDKQYAQVFYSNSNKKLLNDFAKNMYRVFRVRPRIWMQRTATFKGLTRWEKRLSNIAELEEGKNCDLYYPTICGLVLHSIFGKFASGTKKEVTEIMLKSNKDFKSGLIRAFFDDEATVSVGGQGLRLFQDNKLILQSFKTLLEEFSITSSSIKSYTKRDKERY